jgi:hypothetical protein
MMRTSGRICLAFAFTVVCACGPAHRNGDAPTPHIEISPPDVSVTIVNGAQIVQPYTATLVDMNGHRSDVTNKATFTLADGTFGNWAGASLTVTGGGAGPTQVIATDGAVMGSTSLTVYIKGSRVDGGGVPPNAGDLFGNATETPNIAPMIAYPANQILVPPNLGAFDVHWTDTNNNLFEIALHNQYVDMRIYSAAAAPRFTTFTPDEWYSVASTHDPLTLTVAGMSTSTTTQKGTSAPQTVNVTNELVQGGVYYWQNEPTQGVYRYDMSTPNVPPSSFFPGTSQPTSCIGCHGLSQDGGTIAMTLDGGNGRGTILDVASRNVLVPFTAPATPQYWNFATFTPDASKLVTVYQGAMVLRSTQGGAVIAPIPSSSGLLSDHPELSPDGSMLANVETTHNTADYDIGDGSIVVRSFDAASNSFGPIKTLVANATGSSNYYPSWSPDGKWLLFTRTTGISYSDPSAEVWVIAADGSSPPIQLGLADTSAGSLKNSWARWTPFAQSWGPNHEPVFFITFSSVRAFGVRPLTSSSWGTNPQIWMAPFFPGRAAMGMDPSGPSFRMPFQDLGAGNHIAQWTHAIVIARNPDGSLLTQAELYGVKPAAKAR